MIRKIIKIDEELCDGCGLCATACAEGAIRIIDGKAKLVSETYCDGLGNCLGECPRGAITIEEREALVFDPEAVEAHLEETKAPAAPRHHAGCPGSLSRMLRPASRPETTDGGETMPSSLGNWPVQLSLAPLQAPCFQGADLLIAADCAPFAYADFHKKLLSGKTLVIGCPKLDDTGLYREKLARIFLNNDIKSITIAFMEVPCCFGLVALVRQALADAGKTIPSTITKIGIDGEVRETTDL